MDDILALLIPIVGFICLVAIVKAVVDSRLRRRLAETHASEELVKAMAEADEQNRKHAALKWGLVLGVTGVGFGLIDVLGLNAEDPGSYGLLLGAAGVGLLAYHYIRKLDT